MAPTATDPATGLNRASPVANAVAAVLRGFGPGLGPVGASSWTGLIARPGANRSITPVLLDAMASLPLAPPPPPPLNQMGASEAAAAAEEAVDAGGAVSSLSRLTLAVGGADTALWWADCCGCCT